MRRTALLCASLSLSLLPACARGPDTTTPAKAEYASEAEELAYLSALASPTLEQFRRREELRAEADEADRESLERIRRQIDEEDAELEAKSRRAELPGQRERLEQRLRSARIAADGGSPGIASMYLEELLKEFPDAPEAEQASKDRVSYYRQAYRRDPDPIPGP